MKWIRLGNSFVQKEKIIAVHPESTPGWGSKISLENGNSFSTYPSPLQILEQIEEQDPKTAAEWVEICKKEEEKKAAKEKAGDASENRSK